MSNEADCDSNDNVPEQIIKDISSDIDQMPQDNNLNNVPNTMDTNTSVSTCSHCQRVKNDFTKVKQDYKASLDRENELSLKVQKFDQQTVKIAELDILNEELREQLNDLMKENVLIQTELKRVTDEKSTIEKSLEMYKDEKNKLRELEDHISSLEMQCENCKNEVVAAQEKLRTHDLAAKKAISALKKELQLRVDQVTKMYEDCLREKDNLSTKVAQLQDEKKEIVKMTDTVDSRLSHLVKENEKLQQAVKSAQSEYKASKVSFVEQAKDMELKEKEIEKYKEEVNSHVVKVKWAQNKLKTELDAHKETKVKLSQTIQKLKEAKEEGKQIRSDCQAMIKQYQESEEMKSNSLDQELKLKESQLEKHTLSIATQDVNNKNLAQELAKKKDELKISKDEVNSLTSKLNGLEEKVAKYAQAISTYEKTVVTQRKEIDNHLEKIEELDKYRILLHNAEEKNSVLITDKSLLTDTMNELEAEMSGCRAKESDLLNSMEKLTGKCTQLQSTLTVVQAQNEEMKKENEDLKHRYDKLKTRSENISSSLRSDSEAWKIKEAKLQANIDEKTKAVRELATDLGDAKNELKVLKKKNAAHMKDITKQLQQSKKKVDALEKNVSKERLSSDSRTSSSNSIDKTDNGMEPPPLSPTAYAVNNGAVQTGYNNYDLMSTEVQVKTAMTLKNNHELDREKSIMLEKICMLQKQHARYNEKMDFLEEHNRTLVDELTKKNRIIQHYMVKEDSGQLTSTDYDEKKAKLAKNRGVMSSVYSSKATDATMTLELSLEINKKLQGLLEDTLIKNMTLKGNIDTLGDEVARLSRISSEQTKPGR